jgi:hypothetical protein
MNPLARLALIGLLLVLPDSLVSCSPGPVPQVSPSATASASPSSDEPRFLIECAGVDGTSIGPFTRLEEAWASTNYVRIDHCEASSATGAPPDLTADEQRIADTAAADLPEEDPVDLYLQVLATCVRVSPTSAEGLATLPTSILRATLQLCPEAPHAGLVEDELQARS